MRQPRGQTVALLVEALDGAGIATCAPADLLRSSAADDVAASAAGSSAAGAADVPLPAPTPGWW